MLSKGFALLALVAAVIASVVASIVANQIEKYLVKHNRYKRLSIWKKLLLWAMILAVFSIPALYLQLRETTSQRVQPLPSPTSATATSVSTPLYETATLDEGTTGIFFDGDVFVTVLDVYINNAGHQMSDLSIKSPGYPPRRYSAVGVGAYFGYSGRHEYDFTIMGFGEKMLGDGHIGSVKIAVSRQ